MARRTDLFPTVTTDGGLLTSEMLARVAGGDRTLPGLRPEDYHLAPSERLGEMINRSWNRLVGAWTGFSEALSRQPPGEAATGLTRERWLLVLFSELGYGRLQVAELITINDVTYPVSHTWAGVPIHLVGARVDLDRRTAGVAGAARRSPHSLVQELLNRSPERLWGIVGNGLKLRMLRDNASLTRQAFVEFDIAAMMNGEVYADFALLWLVFHESRFAGDPAECWLERWMGEADVRGTRALDHLRGAVQEAIVALGSGFLSQPANTELRDGLRLGEVSPRDYYRLVLRLVYRILFLFVAEDRDLLHADGTPPEVRDLYHHWYSLDRLRRLAERKRFSAHHDLYESLKVVMEALDESGLEALGLPGLGSFLWARDAIGALGRSRIANRDLLAAVRALAFIRQSGARRPVDYRNLGPEELGSVYESLLELHPQVHVETGRFELSAGAASERKSTGSYYTPTSLINSLLDTALQPVLEEAASKPNPEQAVLQLKVIDPACGSGHFLLAAAGRIAKQLASIRTGDEEPSPAAVRFALRDVIARCVFGVDRNEMAVELCKVNLWLESLEPGKPLAFLEHHVVLGDSLMGTTPALMAGGLPDDAFLPIEGDDPKFVRALRKANRVERAGQMNLTLKPGVPPSQWVVEMTEMEAAGQDSIAQIRNKEARFRKLTASRSAAQARIAADAWCAAFVAPKVPGQPSLSQDVLSRLADGDVEAEVTALVRDIASEYKFHHWHLAFPQVFSVPADGPSGWKGGFDVVLGNPPWERIKLQEQEWFEGRRPEIAAAPGAQRKKMIAELPTRDPNLFAQYKLAVRRAEAVSHFVRNSGRYPLAGRGDVNTYSVFAELMRSILAPTGRMGAVLPTGVATDDTNKTLFSSFINEGTLATIYGFENEEFVFPGIHHATKFCLFTSTGPDIRGESADFIFFARNVRELADQSRHFQLSRSDFELLNPNTLTSPVFRFRTDADLARKVYSAVPILIREGRIPNGEWNVNFQAMFHMTNDSSRFRRAADLRSEGLAQIGNRFVGPGQCYLPLYESKMIHIYDHRFGTYEGQSPAQARQGKLPELTDADHSNPERLPWPSYWVSEGDVEDRLRNHPRQYLIAFRLVTSAGSRRTFIPAVIPRVAVGNSAPLLFVDHSSPEETACFIACLSSLVFDFVTRQKIGGNNMNFFVVEQLPVLPPAVFRASSPWQDGSLDEAISRRVLELVYTSSDTRPFAQALGFKGSPYSWNASRRKYLQAQLDALFFRLYNFERSEVEYAIDRFPLMRQADLDAHGDFTTKNLILREYDALTEWEKFRVG
jgi:N-6 DNA Methylase